MNLGGRYPINSRTEHQQHTLQALGVPTHYIVAFSTDSSALRQIELRRFMEIHLSDIREGEMHYPLPNDIFSLNAFNALRRGGVREIGVMLLLSEDDIRKLRGGTQVLPEIQQLLTHYREWSGSNEPRLRHEDESRTARAEQIFGHTSNVPVSYLQARRVVGETAVNELLVRDIRCIGDTRALISYLHLIRDENDIPQFQNPEETVGVILQEFDYGQ